jgi:hypothetical protein
MLRQTQNLKFRNIQKATAAGHAFQDPEQPTLRGDLDNQTPVDERVVAEGFNGVS